MSKTRISASVSEEIAELSSQTGINRSELIEQLLRQHFNAGGDGADLLEFRIEQVESELEELESRAEQKRGELARLRERQEDKTNRVPDAVKNAAENIPPSERHKNDRKVTYWARQAGMSEQELLDELQDYDST